MDKPINRFFSETGPPKRSVGRPKKELTSSEAAIKQRTLYFLGHCKSFKKTPPGSKEQIEHWLTERGFPNIRCPYCNTLTDKATDVNIDHKTPMVLGGANTFDNLQLVCGRCNKRKGNHTHMNLILWAKTVYDNFKAEIEAELKERQKSLNF